MDSVQSSEDVLRHRHPNEERDDALVLRHFLRTLTKYRYAILLALALTLVGYTIVAMAVYLTSPSQKTVSLPFRLDFKGAENSCIAAGRRV